MMSSMVFSTVYTETVASEVIIIEGDSAIRTISIFPVFLKIRIMYNNLRKLKTA